MEVLMEGGSQWQKSKCAWSAAWSHTKDVHWEENWHRCFSLLFFPSSSIISVNTKSCMFTSLQVTHASGGEEFKTALLPQHSGERVVKSRAPKNVTKNFSLSNSQFYINFMQRNRVRLNFTSKFLHAASKIYFIFTCFEFSFCNFNQVSLSVSFLGVLLLVGHFLHYHKVEMLGLQAFQKKVCLCLLPAIEEKKKVFFPK